MFNIISHQEMQIKATRYHTAPKHMAINKREKKIKIKWAEYAQKLKHSYTRWKIVWLFLKIKLKTELKKDPANSTPRHIFKRTENISSQKNLYINVHSSVIYNSQIVHQMMNG